MTQDPTIVHTVADLRREALLAEAAAAWRATPTSERTTGMRRGQTFQHVVTHVAGMVGRIIDDFEPIPAPTSSNTGRLEP